MFTISVKTLEHTEDKNQGRYKEKALAYTLTGEIRKGDRIAYDKGSDIPEYNMSVKSAGFSLMHGNLCEAQDFDGIVNQYMANVASTCVAYVSHEMVAYIMDMTEFREFLYMSCSLCRESQRHGGRYKVKMRSESKKVMAWLSERVAC